MEELHESEHDERERTVPMGWLLGIAATLVAAGIVTSISFSISVSRELGTISARLQNLESGASIPMANATHERFDAVTKRIDDFLISYADEHKSIADHLSSIELRTNINSERLARIEARLGGRSQ